MISEPITFLMTVISTLSGIFFLLSFILIGLSFNLQKNFKMRKTLKVFSFIMGAFMFVVIITFITSVVPLSLGFLIGALIGLIFSTTIVIWIKISNVSVDWKRHKTTLVSVITGISSGVSLGIYALLFNYSQGTSLYLITVVALAFVSIAFYIFLCSQKPIFYEFLSFPTIGIILLSLLYLNLIAFSLCFIGLSHHIYIILSVVGYLLSLFMFLEFLISYFSAKKYYIYSQDKFGNFVN